MGLMKFYGMLPVWGQNIACWCEGYRASRLRFGVSFRKSLAEYESHNDWTYERMCDYRDAQVRKLVRHCYQSVPYYHDLFDEGGINPDSIKGLADLCKLPVLTKDTIRKNPALFLSSSCSGSRLTTLSTSGTTGSSLVLKVDPANIAQQYAIWWRYRRRLGINQAMWHNEIGARAIVPPSQKDPPYWRVSTPLRQVMYSPYHGNETTYQAYFDQMQKDGFCWIHGKPSLIAPFAAFCVERGISLGNVKYITTGSENLYDFQRSIIQKAFGVKPVTHYGLTEAVANFSENADGIAEVDEDFAAVEFAQEDDFYHVIGTSLINYTMPLLRYDTSDICFVSGRVGRYGRIVDRIDGRNGDCIYLPNGTRVATLAALFSHAENIVEAQIYQRGDYSLVIKYVPRNGAFENDLLAARKILESRIGTAIPISFERVEKVPRTARGKLRYIVSEVKR